MSSPPISYSSPTRPESPPPSSPNGEGGSRLLNNEGMDVDVDYPASKIEADDQAGGEGEDQVQEQAEPRIIPPGSLECEWANCKVTFAIRDDFVHHVKEDHINQLKDKDSFSCQWRSCTRAGTKQASKHSLMTHSRMHTGERPYACTAPGCNKTFTRSDALNKHMKTQHNPDKPILNAPTPAHVAGPSTPSISNPGSGAGAAAPDSDLMLDEDIAEILPRIRGRDVFFPLGDDEKAAMTYIRGMHPREEDGPKSKGKKGSGTGTKAKGRKSSAKDKDKNKDKLSEEDAYPESAKYVDPLDSPSSSTPTSPTLQSTILDPDLPGGKIALLSRSKWQVRYVRAKARMMLVEEENRMRRHELAGMVSQREDELLRRLEGGS